MFITKEAFNLMTALLGAILFCAVVTTITLQLWYHFSIKRAKLQTQKQDELINAMLVAQEESNKKIQFLERVLNPVTDHYKSNGKTTKEAH